jgi:hypothetical protein
MRRTRFGAALGAVLFATAVLAQQQRTPVPPEYLKDGELVVVEANFAISAPGSDWRWESVVLREGRPDAATLFVCLNDQTGEQYTINYTGSGIARIDEDYVLGMIEGVRDRDAKAGASLQYERTDIPVAGSLRTWFPQELPDGTITVHTYVAAFGPVISVSGYSADGQEPPGLAGFVSSMRPLEPVPAQPHQGSLSQRPASPGALLVPIGAYFLVWAVVLGVAWLLVGSRRRHGPLPAAVAAVTITTIWLADIGLASYLVQAKGIADPFLQGRLIAGPAFNGLATVVVAMVWYAAKRRTQAAPPPSR